MITYYRDHVPIISRALRESLEIDASKSVDKKLKLEIDDKFGYTSVHLIARTKGSWATSPNSPWLKSI